MTTIALDLDDASILRTRYDLLRQLKEFYPDLKVSLFYIPFDYEVERNVGMGLMKEKKLQELKDILDWVELIPHGVMHIPREFEQCDRQTMKMILDHYDEAFMGLPYVKGFKAPQWLWNEDVVKELDKHGWWGAVDRNQPKMLKTKRIYQYTHSIDEPFHLSNLSVLKLHGHMTEPSKNNLEDCFINLMKMPRDAKFVFASELVEDVCASSASPTRQPQPTGE
jgi:hypothetical protein